MSLKIVKYSLFILFIFKIDLVGAQIEDTIQKRLFQKDFNSFKAYTDQMPGQKSKCHWTCIRNVAGNYNEGVFYFQKSAPTLGEDAYHKTTFYYRVQVLFVESKFIYFNLGELNYQRIDDKWIPYYKTMDAFKDDSLYNHFKTTFYSEFYKELNETELFEEVNYGITCGADGSKAEIRLLMENLVSKKDTESLEKWLQSANTERQIYGLEGFYLLKKQGIKPNEKQLLCIKNILKKKGDVSICNGLFSEQEEIRKVVKKYKSLL